MQECKGIMNTAALQKLLVDGPVESNSLAVKTNDPAYSRAYEASKVSIPEEAIVFNDLCDDCNSQERGNYIDGYCQGELDTLRDIKEWLLKHYPSKPVERFLAGEESGFIKELEVFVLNRPPKVSY